MRPSRFVKLHLIGVNEQNSSDSKYEQAYS